MTDVAIEKRSKSKTAEQKVWNTKYGPRRVKQALPTLQEAIFAAKGITDDIKSQIEIAAELMGMTPEEVRPEVMKASHTTVRQTTGFSRDPGSARTFVVEKRIVRRVVVPPAGASRYGS
jgi:hypothetical protein